MTRLRRLSGLTLALAFVLAPPALAAGLDELTPEFNRHSSPDDVRIIVRGRTTTTVGGVPGKPCRPPTCVPIVWVNVPKWNVGPDGVLGGGDDCVTYRWFTEEQATGDQADHFNALWFDWNILATSGIAVPGDCPGTPPIDPGSLTVPVLGEASAHIAPPRPALQPSGQQLVGKRSYLVGDIPASVPLTFTVQLPTGNVTVTGTATLDHYLVDWTWDGSSSIDAAAAADTTRNVTGPHAPDEPRGWENDSVVSEVYADAGTHLLAVQPVWRIEVTALGQSFSDIRATTPATITVSARQAQAVRQS